MLIKILVPLLFISHIVMGGTNQEPVNIKDSLPDKVTQLIKGGEYAEAEAVLKHFQSTHPANAEVAFLLGFTLAKQEKWSLSRDQFERAVTLKPGYLAAIIELAGVQYKLGSLDKAIELLQSALELEPNNAYTSEFLANLLYLGDRKIEALEYWNKVGKPLIQNISYRSALGTETTFLQELFSLNEEEVLRRKQILDIWWKQDRFDLGQRFSWYITPSSNDAWDLVLNLPPKTTLSSVKTVLLSNAVRVPVYREAVIEYPLELSNGNKFTGIVRWDKPQKRLSGTAWFPFIQSKSDGFGTTFDWRDEDWVAGQTEIGFEYETTQIQARYEHLSRGRKALSFHAGYEHQILRFEEIQPQEYIGNYPDSSHFINLGLEWNQCVGLTVSDNVKVEWKVRYTNHSGLDGKQTLTHQLFSSASLDWRSQSPWDFEFKTSVAGGHSSPNIPLNKYFSLGVGQDNPLPLRAHPTVVDDRKGKNPIGRQFILGNLELHRNLVHWWILNIKGQLFMDIGTVYETPFTNESRVMYKDIGGGLIFSALGSNLIKFLVGYDLNTDSTNFWIGVPY